MSDIPLSNLFGPWGYEVLKANVPDGVDPAEEVGPIEIFDPYEDEPPFIYIPQFPLGIDPEMTARAICCIRDVVKLLENLRDYDGESGNALVAIEILDYIRNGKPQE